MEPKSELERFLQARTSEGQIDSRGQFTLAAEEALRKIAEFQLPFEGAWAAKIVQSVVAGGSTSPIRVDLLATEIRFYFLDPGFTLDELENAFPNPEPSENRSLRHLLSGLWTVGLSKRWGFQVAFPGQSNTLIWDGDRINRVESPEVRDCALISIAPLQQRSALSWVAGLALAGGRNAEIQLALGRVCYVCPLPLTVDGRRIDSMQRAEHHGWSKTTYPLVVGFADEPSLATLRVPPGTFEPLPKSLRAGTVSVTTPFLDGDGGGWERVAEKRMKGLGSCEKAAVPFIVSVHMELVSQGNSNTWKESTGPCTVYWVLDGAQVGEEPLLTFSSHCSVGCFLSAEGLETDLSTFHLLESEGRSSRVSLARTAIHEPLGAFGSGDFEEMVKRGTLVRRAAGSVVIAAGLGLLWVSPVYGVGVAVTGASMIGSAGSTERNRVSSVLASLGELRHRLRREVERLNTDF